MTSQALLRKRAPDLEAASRLAAAVSVRLDAGDRPGAVALLAQHADVTCATPVLARLLAQLHLDAGRHADAMRWFASALRLSPGDAAALHGHALALHGLGRLAEAVAGYDLALACAAQDAALHYNRAIALEDIGDLDAALAGFEAAIRCDPAHVRAMKRSAALLDRLGRGAAAMQALARALDLAPQDAGAWFAHGNLLQKDGRLEEAVAAYDRVFALGIRDAGLFANRAAALKDLGRLAEARADAHRALACRPDLAEALLVAGNIAQDLGFTDEALDHWRQLAEVAPLSPVRATSPAPDAVVLFVFAPACGNMPIRDLIEDQPFESRILHLVAGVSYDMPVLARGAGLAFSLLSDPDGSASALALAETVLAATGLPVLNPPARIRIGDRAQVAQHLSGIADACVPATRRIAAGRAHFSAADWCGPIVLRRAGTHGGEAMALCRTAQEARAFVAQMPAEDLYATDFVDYRSPDGFFRKYRFVFVGDRILPYHLAIGRGWKVHHATTDMADHAWMQEEELRFLVDPASVFGAGHGAALEAIRTRIGLDMFGIDCALTPDGRLLVFEVNASMLVRRHNARFPYKDPYAEEIRRAFAALMRDRSNLSRESLVISTAANLAWLP